MLAAFGDWEQYYHLCSAALPKLARRALISLFPRTLDGASLDKAGM